MFVISVGVGMLSLIVQSRNCADTYRVRVLNYREDLRRSGCH